MRCLAADRKTGPRKKFPRIAPDNFYLFPGHGQHIGRNSRQVHDRMSSQIAYPGLDVEFSVRPDRHDSVVADRARSVRSHGNSDAADFRTLTLARSRLALRPLEALGAAVERFFHKCACCVRPL